MDRSPHLPEPSVATMRGGFAALLLGIAVVWLVAMAVLVFQAEDAAHVAPLFGILAVPVAYAGWAAWNVEPVRERHGRLALWYAFGLTLAWWMIGIFSIGWFFLPALLLELFALIAWPRPAGASVVSREGIYAEIAGFLTGPVGLVLAFSLIGR